MHACVWVQELLGRICSHTDDAMCCRIHGSQGMRACEGACPASTFVCWCKRRRPTVIVGPQPFSTQWYQFMIFAVRVLRERRFLRAEF